MMKSKSNQRRQKPKKTRKGQQTAQVPGNRVSTRAVNAPVASASVMHVSKQGNMSKFRLSERIASVTVDNTTPTGEPLLQLLLNPSTWEGSRVSQESRLWQQYRFTRLTLRAIPGIPTICSGQYIHGSDMEAEEPNAVNGDALIAYMSNLPGAVLSPVWKETASQCPVEAYLRSQAWYRLENSHPELPDYCAGVYTFALTQPFSGITAGSAGFTIWADGEIEFCGRRLTESPSITPNAINITNEIHYYVGRTGSASAYNEDGRYYFVSGNNDLAQMKIGYAYISEPFNMFPAILDAGGNNIYSAAVRLGPGDGGVAHFYKSLSGALSGDPTDLVVPGAGQETYEHWLSSGTLHPVKLPAGAPTFRARGVKGQVLSRAPVKARQQEPSSLAADIAHAFADVLTTTGLLSLGSELGSFVVGAANPAPKHA